METFHPPKDAKETVDDSALPEKEGISEKWLREKIDSLIPVIKEKWPTIAQQTLETAKGSIDDLVEVIASHTGTSAGGIKNQLFEIIDSIQENNWEIAEKIEPIESQLEELLDELNNSLRPKITIGFAAETNNLSTNAKEKLNEKNCDWVIANDVSDQTIGFGSDFNKISIFYKDKPEENFEKMSKSLVAEEIVKRVIQQIN